MNTKIKNYEILLLSLLIATSPMYWFFGVSPVIFGLFKLGLVITVFLLALRYYATFSVLRYLDLITVSILIGIIAILALFGIGQSADFFVSSSYPFLYYIVLLYSFRTFIARDDGYINIGKVVNSINIIIILLTTIIIASHVLGLNLTAPSEFKNFPITFSGFGSLRTGWSAGLAMFVGGNIYFILSGVVKENKLIILSIVLVIVTQYLSGGRGGLLTSLVIVCYYLFSQKKYLQISVLTAIMFTLIVSNIDILFEHLRLNDSFSNSSGGISAGRTMQYKAAFDLFLDNNLLPYGAYGYMDAFHNLNIVNTIHNVWIRLTIENGIIFILTLITFIYVGIYRADIKRTARNILLLMLIATFFEPAAVLINVNNYLMWWFAFSFNSSFNAFNRR